MQTPAAAVLGVEVGEIRRPFRAAGIGKARKNGSN
jgi:hypothetical protein